MNQSTASATSRIQRWASRQLADYDARRPGTMFAEGVVLDVAQGYELQSAVAQLRCGRGERVIGVDNVNTLVAATIRVRRILPNHRLLRLLPV